MRSAGSPAGFDGLSFQDYAALLTGDVEDYKDADGRPIGEVRASPEARAGVATEYKRCPYSGSRHDHERPMNVSSLRQSTRDWPQIIGALDFVGTAYRRRHPATPPSLAEYWRLATAMSLLPAYFMFRHDGPIADGHIPPFAGSINKMLGGIMSVCSKLTLAELSAGRTAADSVVTPGLILEAAEATGSLIGATEVCAGTPMMLETILRVISHGAAAEREVDRAAIGALLPDPEAFLDYAEAAAELTLVLFVCSLQIGAGMARIARALERPGLETLADRLRDLRARAFFQRYTPGMPIDTERGDALAEAIAPLLRTDVSALLSTRGLPEAGSVHAWCQSRVAAQSLPPECLAVLLGELTGHLGRESEALRILTPLQARVHEALGRPRARHALTGSDLSALFGHTPVDFAEAAFGIHVRNQEGSTLLRCEHGALRVDHSRPHHEDATSGACA